MTILRNNSKESFVISINPPFHLMPGRAVDIPDSLLETTQIKNLMKMGFLKPVKLQERSATVSKKTAKKSDVKKEEKKEEKKAEAVKKNSDDRSGEKSERTIEYKTLKKEGL